jgi:hypothetical protein
MEDNRSSGYCDQARNSLSFRAELPSVSAKIPDKGIEGRFRKLHIE